MKIQDSISENSSQSKNINLLKYFLDRDTNSQITLRCKKKRNQTSLNRNSHNIIRLTADTLHKTKVSKKKCPFYLGSPKDLIFIDSAFNPI